MRQGVYLCYGRVSGSTPPSDWEGLAPLPFEPGIRLAPSEELLASYAQVEYGDELVTWVETLQGEEPHSRFSLEKG